MVQLVVTDQITGDLHYLDISDVSIKGNYSAREIQEVTEQKSDFTQSFSLPLSQTNNDFFSHFYNVNSQDGTFDSTIKTRASIYVDSNLVFEGYLQLLKVNNKTEFYEAIVFGEVANIAASLKENKLNDLDLSVFNHVLTRANIKDSWNGSIAYTSGSTGDEILYPIIDYGYLYTNVTLNNSSVSGGLLPSRLKPTIKVKTLFEKILSNIGYTVNSTFFGTDFFSKQYMTLSQEFQTVQSTFQDNFKVGMGANQVITTTSIIQFNDDSTSPFFDFAGNFNTAAHAYTVALSGYHRFRLKLKGSLSGTAGVTYIVPVLRSLSTGTVYDNIFPGSWNGSNYSPLIVATGTQEIDIVSNNQIFAAGDTIAVELVFLASANNFTIDSSGTEFSIYTAPVSEESSTVDLSAGNSTFPKDRQIDFITSIMSRYNLIIALDKDVPFQLNIEPAQDYYDQGVTKDWSDKLDMNKDYILKPTNEFRKQAIKFEDLEGEGDLNTYWQGEFKHAYNHYEADLEGDFGQGLLEVKTIFESFNCKRLPEHDMLISKGYKTENGTVSFVESKPQLFVYSGLKDCMEYRFWSQASDDYTTETQYPFCHHYLMAGDAVVESDKDIRFKTAYSFDQPYFVNEWPVNDTFAECWRRYLNNIYSKDSRILIANFYLDPEDVANFKYNDKIFVLDNFYRINKISNYALGKNISTTVELIKIIDSNLFDTNEILGCNLSWSTSNINGTTGWINEVGAPVTPTQECCEAQNLVFANNQCFWNYNPVTPPDPQLPPISWDPEVNQTGTSSGGVIKFHEEATIIKTNPDKDPSIFLGGQIRRLGKPAANGQFLRWNAGTDQTVWGYAVSQIIAGTNITISPSGGTGQVTINATGGGGGTPGGSNTEVQYNDAGTFGADANFTFDSTQGEVNALLLKGTHRKFNIGSRAARGSASNLINWNIPPTVFNIHEDSARPVYTSTDTGSVQALYNSRAPDIYATFTLPTSYEIKSFIVYTNNNLAVKLIRGNYNSNAMSSIHTGVTNTLETLTTPHIVSDREYYTFRVTRTRATDEIYGAILTLQEI